jgi:alpha-tubulin suppressor-like RCC1 family protein
MKKRQLLFDSLSKIVSRSFGAKGLRSKKTAQPKSKGTLVFTWGAGYHGQLGRVFNRAQRKYALVPEKAADIQYPVRQVTCGVVHSAAVTDNGALFTWGDARSYQLGYSPVGFTNQAVPRMVDGLSGYFITQVACGETHTVALSDKHQLISWGKSKFGQCGHGDRQTVKTPRLISSDGLRVKFVDVNCGDRHTVAVTSQGHVYSFGCGKHGQLGLGTRDDCLVPRQITSLESQAIVSVACGAIHSTFLNDAGSVYCCGFGEHFYQNQENFNYKPVLIEFDEVVVQTACGQSHILALTEKGDVYAWGSGQYGQLGHGVKGSLGKPRLILANKSIAQVAAGRYHSIALTTFGVLYTWGCGETGQLGHNSDSNIFVPRVVEPNLGTVVGQIACGEHHTAVLSSTQWTKVDTDVLDWVKAEKEEYSQKMKYLKTCNRGLLKSDLDKIEEIMLDILESWDEEAKQNEEFQKKEEEEKLRQIRRRKSVTVEVTRDLLESRQSSQIAARQQYLENHGGNSRRNSSATSRTSNNNNNNNNNNSEAKSNSGGFALPSMQDDTKVEDPEQSQPRFHYRSNNSGANTSRKTARGRSNGLRSPRISGARRSSKSLTARPSTARRASAAGSTSGKRFNNGSRANWLKETSSQLAKMKSVIAQSGEAANKKRLRQATRNAFVLRREHDAQKREIIKKKELLKELRRESKSLAKVDDEKMGKEKSAANRLKKLEMKLNTVQIKIAETEENRSNYQLNIAHLKEEEIARHNQL